MLLYVDSSAWVKRYVLESESAACVEAMSRNRIWVTCRHSIVEVTRTLALRIEPGQEHAALGEFNAEIGHANIVEPDLHLCALASDIAIETGARSLDALHIAAALRAGSGTIAMLTYDVRQAVAAEKVGLSVLRPTS